MCASTRACVDDRDWMVINDRAMTVSVDEGLITVIGQGITDGLITVIDDRDQTVGDPLTNDGDQTLIDADRHSTVIDYHPITVIHARTRTCTHSSSGLTTFLSTWESSCGIDLLQ